MNGKRRVVVTGLGAITPIGNDVPSFWEANKLGKSGAAPISAFDASEYTTKIGCEIKDFDPTDYVEKREARKLDPFSQYGIAAALEAIKDSGLDIAAEPDAVGCIMGTGIGGLWEIEKNFDKHRRDISKVSPFFIPKEMANAVSGNIAITAGARGPNFVVASACASASHAIGTAFRMVQSGISEAMITGGSEAALTPLGLAGFCNLRALTRRNDEPEKASRPFDKDRDGFIMGNGAGVLIIESLDHAIARGAKIYAEILGFGANDDAFHITAPSEDGSGATACMATAVRDAGRVPTDIDYINAHGTSTPLNDPRETMAIKRLFEDHAYKIPVSSTKSMIGHLLGASGGVELIATCLAIHEGWIPPTINYETPDPECDLDYVPNEGRTREIKCAICNSFGFGGHNATVCVGRYES
jgi:3-oxoacyl-[acyl-carrier-protein] synthase II